MTIRNFETGEEIAEQLGRFEVKGPDLRMHIVRLLRTEKAGVFLLPCCDQAIWAPISDFCSDPTL